ncbi:hypothetical protein [Entomospira culicis]|uniref:Septum formation initiator n=1 Tax=Entomospira culicis TaxID=2719989 RepID=A0A968GDL1_9SPIO|nr:hypothetical protein [Entomospira culicis]NIZ18450.1 hypothetical protein [Entomospira culicis]NIZ68666.1 hypothetical protein [Entomospira culicis]WDI37265.1 hypothetical protein PVA46_00300 [Entomospira culicis]WDI38894.1 hypothetical protein PVA47_00310 [Entomospira culicis]
MLSRYKKIWWALYAGLLSLLLVDLFLGSMNFGLQAQQRREIEQMQENLDALLSLQVMLEAIKADHEHNDETIILEARKVGFFRPNEALIVVRGVENLADNREVGQVVRQVVDRKPALRWYGIFAFVVAFCLVLMGQLFLHREEE